jgi:hypothetical protein
MKNKGIIAVLILVLFILPWQGFTQCKGFTKKYCKSQLDPYIFNGQLNSAVLSEGDIAELQLTLYSGQNYRICVCSQENLGKTEFRLIDMNNNLIFNNKEHDFVTFWDLTTDATQQITVQVKIPVSEHPTDIIQNGCVSILVGFKE